MTVKTELVITVRPTANYSWPYFVISKVTWTLTRAWLERVGYPFYKRWQPSTSSAFPMVRYASEAYAALIAKCIGLLQGAAISKKEVEI